MTFFLKYVKAICHSNIIIEILPEHEIMLQTDVAASESVTNCLRSLQYLVVRLIPNIKIILCKDRLIPHSVAHHVLKVLYFFKFQAMSASFLITSLFRLIFGILLVLLTFCSFNLISNFTHFSSKIHFIIIEIRNNFPLIDYIKTR